MNATPRPWIIGKNAADYKGRVTIRDAEGWEIAQIPGLPSDQPHERQDANAGLIIRAVNSYDAWRQYIETIAGMTTEEEFDEDCPPSEDWICTLNELIERARVLTSKKKGAS